MTQDISASIRARLLNQAKATGEEFERTLVRYAAERLLYRLGKSAAADRCLLKGASLLSVWLTDPHRATRDVDLLAFGAVNEQAIRALVEEICAVSCPEDGLRFDLSDLKVEDIREEEAYSGKRARFQAYLGSARIAMQLDIGTGDAVVHADKVELSPMIDGLPPARLRAYPRENSVAEKLEAMIKLDVLNSRMKDFHDVWALAMTCEFDGVALQEAVASCFERRATAWTSETPRPLTRKFYEMPEMQKRWSGYLMAGSILVRPPARFEEIGDLIVRFLAPVREAIINDQPLAKHWPAGGPWASKSGS